MSLNTTTYGDTPNTNADDRYDYFTIENGGVVDTIGTVGEQDKPDNVLNIDEYSFRITSNIDNADIIVNGEVQSSRTPSIIKFKKSDFFEEGISKTITISKTGYTSNERYELFITSLTEDSLEDTTLSRDESGFVNLKDIDFRIRYYVDDVLTPFNEFTSLLTQLNFTLRESVERGSDERRITTALVGDDGSAVLERIRDGRTFAVDSDTSSRTDNQGTRYLLKSVDTSSYRIAAIRVRVDGKVEEQTADDGESLRTEITLNNDVELEIATQRLVVQERLQPRIRVPNRSPRMLNKNEPTGIPIIIYKNRAVRAISVVIGEEMIEFDNLPKRQRCAIALPARLFEQLGSYRVKIFPYSISQLESFTLEEFDGDIAEQPEAGIV